MGPGGHELVTALDDDLRLALFILRFNDHPARKTGHFIHFFLHGDTLGQILELNGSTHLGQNGVGIRIPFHQAITHLDLSAIFHLDLSPVNYGITLLLTSLFIHNRDEAIAIHDDKITVLIAHGGKIDEFDDPVVFGFQRGLL